MAPVDSIKNEQRIVGIVFKALLIDLLAFTIILPLFPRLLNYYQQEDLARQGTLLGYALQILEQFKRFMTVETVSGQRGDKWDTVLLGGLVGSFFSFLQFIVSPWIGRASDKMGRRKVLLWTMVGNIASTLIWLFSRSFSTFLLARLIGGLSEGNVQLSIAIISDITLPERRSRNLALVGIAFAVAFTFGPPLGAWFASIDLAKIYPETSEWGIYPYSMPALVAMGLLVIETVYLAKYLPETRHQKSTETSEPKTSGATAAASQDSQGSVETRLLNLRRLNILQCLFSLLFSGMEFTLVFLTFDVLDYSHMQQGKLLGTMGIMSSLIQGGYVRRKVQVVGEKALVIQGMVACVVGLGCLAITALRVQQAWLYCGVCFLAFTSGTVVNCLTSLASLQCDDDHAENNRLAKGRALGEFRSFGQLGRALGPVSACGLYWMTGPVCCYSAGAIVMATIAILTALWAPLRRIKSD